MPRVATGESVTERIDRLLSSFDTNHRSLRVGELSRRAGLSLPTTSRLVAQLVDRGWLERDERSRVRPGLRLWELGQFAAPVRDFREAALPALQGLHAVVRQHAQLSVLSGSDVVVVERLSYPGSVVNYSVQGAHLPAHASASGLVLLAHSPVDAERVFARALERFTDSTTVDPDALRRVLARVRAEGFVVTDGAIDPRASSAAVPVTDHRGRVRGAISVIVPNDGTAARWVPMLQAAARTVQATESPVAAESVWDDARRSFVRPTSPVE